MIFKYYQRKCRTPAFYNQGFVHWLWFLAITCDLAVIFLPFATAWALLTPSFVAVDNLAKITLSDFKCTKSSNIFYGRAESISHPYPIQLNFSSRSIRHHWYQFLYRKAV